MVQATTGALRVLALELKNINEQPVEGFLVKLLNDDNMFEWEVAMFGPPDTLYQGGYFKAQMKFPENYPFSPPSIRFVTKVWHPNVYINGDLCISILHPQVNNPESSVQLSNESWNPTQSARTILLSVISILNEPNISSPANIDASNMFRRWKESNGKDKEYEDIIKIQVNESQLEAEKDGVIVPTTVEEYCNETPSKPNIVVVEEIDCYDLYPDYESEDKDKDED